MKKSKFKGAGFWLGLGSIACWLISEILDGLKDDMDMREIAKEVYQEERAKENKK